MSDIQPSSKNPFGVLGLQPQFRMAHAEVERAFLSRIAQSHPDLTGEEGSGDAAVLNEARKILLDPESRAIAFLSALGGKSASEDKTLPDGFLMDMMEQRQEIEDDLAEGDDEALVRWQQWAADERARYESVVAELFDAYQSEQLFDSLEQCRAQLNAWRYIERLIEQLDPSYNPAQADFN